MKKIILAGALALSLTTTLSAEIEDMELSEPGTTAEVKGHWYVGAEYSTGSGTTSTDYSDYDFDSSGMTLKVGYVKRNFNKVEFQYTAKTLDYPFASNDVTEYKINFVTSIMKISYKEIVIPYFEAAIGYGDSEFFGGQFATHLGLGVMVNPIDMLELTVGYRLSTNLGTDDNDNFYSDQHGDMIIGAAYKF